MQKLIANFGANFAMLGAGHAMSREHACKGAVLHSRPCRVEKTELLAFAAAFDPQPAHTDERAAAATALNGLAASGWHTLALVASQVEQALCEAGCLCRVSAIDDLRWLKPVRPDDMLLAQIGWTSGEPCSCPAERGRRGARIEVRNQRGEIVGLWHCDLLSDPEPGSPSEWAQLPDARCSIRMPRAAKATPRLGEHFIKYFEDVARGDAIDLGGYEFNHQNVALYNGLLGSRASRQPRDDVDGFNLLAVWMRLIVEYYDRQAQRLAAVGRSVPVLGPATGVKWLRWPKRVLVGEHVQFCAWVEHKIDMSAAGRWGLLVAGGEGRNARGEIVVSFYPQFLLERRMGRDAAGAGNEHSH